MVDAQHDDDALAQSGEDVWRSVRDMDVEERQEMLIRADTVRGIFGAVDPYPRPDLNLEHRHGRVGSADLAMTFDPVTETSRRIAALLLGVRSDDLKWLACAGIPITSLWETTAHAEEWISRDGWRTEGLGYWADLLRNLIPLDSDLDESEHDANAFECFSWREALKILEIRPWLLISWVRFPTERRPHFPGQGGHLVVHDGTFGAALHLDDPAGPTLGGHKIAPTSLDWEDLADAGSADWDGLWGVGSPKPVQTERSATLAVMREALTGADLGSADGHLWSARPAELIPAGGTSADDLTEIFPTAWRSIDRYRTMISGEFHAAENAGGTAYWHEPLWVVRRGTLPVLLFDEAGQVHLPSSDWLALAEGLPTLGTPSGDPVDSWPAQSFEIGELLRVGEAWSGQWMASAEAVVGDLLRAGAGYVRAYLDVPSASSS